MNLLVTGARDWTDVGLVCRTLDAIHAVTPIELLIEGAAAGVDDMASEWAMDREVPNYRVPARWGAEGPAGGPRHNQRTREFGPDLVLAIHDDIARSRGTRDMVIRARTAGIEVRAVRHRAEQSPPGPAGRPRIPEGSSR